MPVKLPTPLERPATTEWLAEIKELKKQITELEKYVTAQTNIIARCIDGTSCRSQLADEMLENGRLKERVAVLEREVHDYKIQLTPDEINARAAEWDTVLAVVTRYKGHLGDVRKVHEAIESAFAVKERLDKAEELVKEMKVGLAHEKKMATDYLAELKRHGWLGFGTAEPEARHDPKTGKIFYPGFVCPVCFKEQCDCDGDPEEDDRLREEKIGKEKADPDRRSLEDIQREARVKMQAENHPTRDGYNALREHEKEDE